MRHWLPKLEAGGVALQVCPLYPTLEQVPEAALRTTLEQVAALHRAVAENGERVSLVRTRTELDAVERADRIGLVLSMEGVEPLGVSADLVDPSPPDALLPPGTTLGEGLEGLSGPEDYGELVAALRGRGFDAGALDAILWRNLARVVRSALP